MTEVTFIEVEPNPGERYELADGATIGREACDVVLEDAEVSRRHAAIRVTPSGPAIEDLGSSNGTFVNERQITGLTTLTPADTVRIGAVVWRLAGPPPAAETVMGAVPAERTHPPVAPTAVPEPAPPPREPTPPPPSAPEPSLPPSPTEPLPSEPAPARLAVDEPLPGAQSGARGDVPAPPDPAASAVRSVPAAAAPLSPPAFATGAAGGRASAARSGTATLASLITVALTALALAVYFGARDEEPSADDRPASKQEQPARGQGN